jgi:hypothetical protein
MPRIIKIKKITSGSQFRTLGGKRKITPLGQQPHYTWNGQEWVLSKGGDGSKRGTLWQA